jgi:hypothetical protein
MYTYNWNPGTCLGSYADRMAAIRRSVASLIPVTSSDHEESGETKLSLLSAQQDVQNSDSLTYFRHRRLSCRSSGQHLRHNAESLKDFEINHSFPYKQTDMFAQTQGGAKEKKKVKMNDSIDWNQTSVNCMKRTEECVRKELFISVNSLHWECFFSPPPPKYSQSMFFTQHVKLQRCIMKGARIARLVQRRTTGWMAKLRFPAAARDFSLLHGVQTGSEAHPASYPMGAGGSFPGSKTAGAWS